MANTSTILDSFRESSAYLFIHPNLDEYADHIQRMEVAIGRGRILKYVVRGSSEKGEFTYNYFSLRQFEIASFTFAQGGAVPDLDAKLFLRAALEALENPVGQATQAREDGA